MLIVCFFLHIKSLPNLLFGVLCLPGDQSHPFAQPTLNPLAYCICWAGLLGHAVFSSERRPEFWVLHIQLYIYIYIYTFNFIYILFFTFFSFICYHKILSIVPCRNYTISPCWLSTLCIVVCLC